MKKPSPAAIRSAVPLTEVSRLHGGDPLLRCGVCGQPVDPDDLPLEIWREHDERDQPIAGVAALVFLGKGKAHAACRRTLDDHPRLYADEEGRPGYFSNLCAGCTFRDGVTCRHPKLRANGGPGLNVTMNDPLGGAIICGRGGRRLRVARPAVACEGRSS